MSTQQDRLSKPEHERIFREIVLPESGLDTYTPQERPKAVILAGQPGAGKGNLKKAVEFEFHGDIFPVDPDEQREFHPEAKRWQKESPYGWSQKTNSDAGAWAGELRNAGVERRVNLLVDTTLGDARSATRLIQGLQKAGYEVEIRAVAAHELESRVGIDRRFTLGIKVDGYGRDVPLTFHDKVSPDLPGNLDTVAADNPAVRVRLYDRDDSVNAVFDTRRDTGVLSEEFRTMRDARLQSPDTTQRMRQEAQEQAGWHRTLPDNPRSTPTLQREHLQFDKPAISARDSDAWSTLDELVRPGALPARAPIPEPADPYPRLRGFNAGLAIEAAVTAYEWNDTRQRAQVFQSTLHNDTAAVDAVVRQGAQTAGVVAGTVAAGTTATALNVGSGGTAALVVGEGYLFGKAAEHGVELWQKHRVYSVESEGVDWTFSGAQWIRKDLRADLVDDGRDLPQQQDFAASPEKARELSAKASAMAVEQALGAVPTPRDPFVQTASDGSEPWTYQPGGGVWTREVVTAYDVNGIASAKDTVEAKGERAAQLSAQAMQVIDANLQAGPAEIAAQYERGHKAYGYAQTPGGAVSAAATTALNPDVLQASDGRHYRRDAQGAWAHEGDAATTRFALELELTHDRLLPSLQDHQQQLARMPDWQPPTPEQLDRAMLRQAYLHKGLDPTIQHDQFDASYLAVQRTREAAGVSAANTSIVLGQNANGTFTLDSPIHHLREEADRKVGIVAITTPDDIALARSDVRARAQGDNVPAQTSPERTITQTTPEERNAREQATREANRQGLSPEDVQQAAQAAVAGAAMRGPSVSNTTYTAERVVEEVSTEDRREPTQTAPAVSPLPPDFAPSQQCLRDLRDPQHEGHHALGEMQHRAAVFETQQHIPHGPHTQRLGASLLVFAVENKLQYSDVRLEKDQDTGQVQIEHARYGYPTQRFAADLAAMSSQPIAATSQRINEAVSKHNANPAPALERTHEQALGLGEYALNDKVLFGIVRGGTPGHISDDHVALAVRMAKEAGIDANNIARVSMVSEQIRLVKSGPDDKTVLVDVSKPAPPLQDSVNAVNTLNQQQAQVLAQQQDQPTQDSPGRGPKML